MEQRGKVISCEERTAQVEVARSSACSSCHRKDSCTEGALFGCSDNKVEITANNLCDARVGDTVELYSSSGQTIFAAFCTFVLPFVLAFIAYFIAFSAKAGEVSAYIIATAVFFISFSSLFYLVNKRMSKKVTVNIVKVLESEKQEGSPAEISFK